MIEAKKKCENCGKRVLCGCASKDKPRPDLLELAKRSLTALREDHRGIHTSENIPRLEAAIGSEVAYRKAVKELVYAAESLAVILHEIEASGVNLTPSQDRRWERASVAIQTMREIGI